MKRFSLKLNCVLQSRENSQYQTVVEYGAIVLMLNFGFLEEFVGANFFEQERNGMNNSKETVARCPWLSETRELCIKCSPWKDYEADVSSVSFSPAQIRILP